MTMKGFGAIKDAMNKSAATLKIKAGESAVVRVVVPADEIISVYEHTIEVGDKWHTFTCLGKNECPACQAGDRAAFKTYLVVADRNDNNKVKIFKASKKVGIQLLGLIEEYGDLTKRDFKISRQGEKLDTTYQFFPRDPEAFDFDSIELPDVEAMVEKKSRAEILAIMGGGGSVSNVDNDTPLTINEDDFPF